MQILWICFIFFTLFLQLVAVYDVLRDANRRMCYDEVLKNGLPDWRQAVYYYRRVRKMGLAEMSIILFVLVTVGQYIVSWASYFERKYTAVSLMNSLPSPLLSRSMSRSSPTSLFPYQFHALALFSSS